MYAHLLSLRVLVAALPRLPQFFLVTHRQDATCSPALFVHSLCVYGNGRCPKCACAHVVSLWVPSIQSQEWHLQPLLILTLPIYSSKPPLRPMWQMATGSRHNKRRREKFRKNNLRLRTKGFLHVFNFFYVTESWEMPFCHILSKHFVKKSQRYSVNFGSLEEGFRFQPTKLLCVTPK